MGKGDAEWRIHIEGLGLLRTDGRSGRGVAHMADAGVARERPHVAGTKDIAHQATVLVHRKVAATAGGNAGSILPPVLQQQQSVIQQLIGGRLPRQTQNSAHIGPHLDAERNGSTIRTAGRAAAIHPARLKTAGSGCWRHPCRNLRGAPSGPAGPLRILR